METTIIGTKKRFKYFENGQESVKKLGSGKNN
jgi:hypothetical protein